MAKRKSLFWCQECGKAFTSVKAAERAAFGDEGCPKCGGSDIDCAPPKPAAPVKRFCACGNTTDNCNGTRVGCVPAVRERVLMEELS